MSGSLLDLSALARALAELPDEELRPLRERLAPRAPTRAGPATPYLTTAEAAVLLGYGENLARGRRRVYELVSDGRLTRHGAGRRLLVSREEVERLAAGA